MLILRALTEGLGYSSVDPLTVFRGLRFVMFMLSFVLEDWAIHELVDTRQQRRVALMLVASSYMTWTWQAHTFSNAVETVIVLWSIVLSRRLAKYEVLSFLSIMFDHLAYYELDTSFHCKDFCHTGCSACVWHLQPYHLPCVCASTPPGTCDPKVRMEIARSRLI